MQKSHLKLSLVSIISLIVLLLNPPWIFSQITKTSSNVFYGLGEALKYHYSLIPLYEPSYSKAVFNNLFMSMDPQKLYFTMEDINTFNSMRFTQGDIFETGDLSLPFTVHSLLLKKIEKRLPAAIELVEASNFDFTKENDTLVINLNKRNWAADESELDLRWKKVIKERLLSEIITEKRSRKTISKAIKNSIISELNSAANSHRSADEFEIIEHYANAFLVPVDPHSSYMTPRAAQEFSNKLSSSLEGIGAVLSSYNGDTIVKRLIPGGPADAEGSLQPHDVIVEVKGEEDKEYFSTIGKNPEYVSDLIKGPKGTEVIVKVISKTGKRKTISLVRDKVDIKEHMISSSVHKVTINNQPITIGILTIPVFYSNFAIDSKVSKKVSVADDFARELVTLQQLHKVDGIVLDVRNNTGGSLTEVIAIAGHLIKNGPVVSVYDSVAGETTKYDTDDTIVYPGPLAIVVNRFSASASEILAGFIKDYNRGLVIGEKTHGKGTSQSLLEINPEMYPHLDKSYGTFKFTTKMFFRVNGKSTQKNGVVPHINYPSNVVDNVFSEASLSNAINAEIQFHKPTPQANGFTPIDLTQLQNDGTNNVYRLARKAIDREKGFSLLKRRLELINQFTSQEVVSLNEEKRRAEYEALNNQMEKINNDIMISADLLSDTKSGEKSGYTTEKNFNAAVDSIEVKTAATILAEYISQKKQFQK